MVKRTILVTKENGEREVFDPGKLIFSLQRAGASDRIIDEVVSHVKSELEPGMSTSEIYRKAFSLLRRIERPVAARYSMKRAVLELGPSGFPFEDFIGEIFKAKGFTVQTGIMMQGSCVEHEVDLLAYNERKFIIGEAKFHNELAVKSDLKVALYVQARFEDLQKYRAERGERKIDECWLITNTKFTKSAVAYANCKGLKIISWTYPRYGNLQDLIEEAKLHPITALPSLSRQEKATLMERGVVLCKNMEENKKLLIEAGIKGAKLEAVLAEGRNLCQSSF
jgi:hypothetical protein